MKKTFVLVIVSVMTAAFAAAEPAVVTITPLGSHSGEFCRNDRALLFEDPTGVRILWDPGRTIAGETDAPGTVSAAPNSNAAAIAAAKEVGHFAAREHRRVLIIPSHANEAATTGGEVNPGTRVDRFIQQLRIPSHDARFSVVLPVSDKKIECDGSGDCR
jgi:hypothetical protein